MSFSQPTTVTLSILIPVYNEAESIALVLERIISEPIEFFRAARVTAELIVVDDGSRDRTCDEIETFLNAHPDAALRLIRHASNQGKGAAIRTALADANGEFCLIQDADLEYDPADYASLLPPLLDGSADMVLGSRFISVGQRRVPDFWHRFANRTITFFAGLAAGLDLTDVETCYKAFRTSLARSIPLRSKRFGLDPELPIKFAQRHARIFEVPVSYRGRTEEQGKKIRAHDAFSALGTILKTSLVHDAYLDPGAAMLGEMAAAKRFNRWMADTILPWIRGEVLELGAGIGNLTVLLCKRRERYVATDSDPEHLMQLRARLAHRSNLRLALWDATDRVEKTSPFHSRFDTVVCLNVLEHIRDDLATLRNIHSCLKPGGTAVVLVPQGMGAFGSLDEVLQHERRYSEAELRQKMVASGFQVAQVTPFNRATYPGWVFNSRYLRRRTLSRFQLRLVDALVPLWRRIDTRLPWPPTSLVAIGVREG